MSEPSINNVTAKILVTRETAAGRMRRYRARRRAGFRCYVIELPFARSTRSFAAGSSGQTNVMTKALWSMRFRNTSSKNLGRTKDNTSRKQAGWDREMVAIARRLAPR
jgi:hypothetical protein